MPRLGVASKDRHLENPPSSEGTIISVDVEHTENRTAVTQAKQCQQCLEPVPFSEPHVRARVRLEDRPVMPVYKNIVFCDRECWASWASR